MKRLSKERTELQNNNDIRVLNKGFYFTLLYFTLLTSRDHFWKNLSKEASTFTFAQTAVLCGDICPGAIISVPFWRWIRACASACPLSSSTRHAAWSP